MATTPNMNLLLPDPTITPGPTYASENNDAFDTIDSHDHTLGKGVPVPTGGLNIDADLAFNAFNVTNLRSSRYVSQTAPLSLPSDINQLYVVNGNLVYNNNLGQPVQITSGAAIDATTIGGIGGDYATSTALVFYTSADKTFTFWSNTNTPANIDAANVTIRNDTLNSFGITLAVDPSIAADYELTLPATLPTATTGLEVGPTGIVTYGGGTVPSGAMIMWFNRVAPSGWLIGDGSSQLIATYPAVAAAFFDSSTSKYAFGQADGTHFYLPPPGVFYRGVDTVGTYDPDFAARTATNTGGNTGGNPGSFQTSANLLHSHFMPGGNNGVTNGTLTIPAQTPIASSNNTAASGGAQSNPNNVSCYFIIKI